MVDSRPTDHHDADGDAVIYVVGLPSGMFYATRWNPATGEREFAPMAYRDNGDPMSLADARTLADRHGGFILG